MFKSFKMMYMSKIPVSEKIGRNKNKFDRSIELIEISRNPKEFFNSYNFWGNGSFTKVMHHFPDLI